MIRAQRKNEDAPWSGVRLYHCSPVIYDWPCMIKAETHVLKHNKHPNGVLGLWLSNVPELCIGFGPYVYETEIGPARIGFLPYGELFGWHRFTQTLSTLRGQVDWYKQKRQEILPLFDVLYVEDNREPSDLLGEIIVVNLDVILKHERTESWIQRKKSELV